MASFGQPTIIDVARKAGVSNMTVSRVVNQNGYVSAKTKRKVENAIAALGYQPNAMAKGMRTNSTKSVGFILPNLTNATTAALAQAVERYLVTRGYRMVLGSTGFSPELEARSLSSFQQNTVDGILAILGDETLTRVHELLRKSRVPMVVIDRDLPFSVDTVLTEHRRCIRSVVKYLSDLGHRRIGLLIPPLTIRPGRERHAAFVDAMRDAGLTHDPSLIRLRQELAANGHQAMLELLKSPRRPTAVLVGAGELTFGAMQAVRELGMRIPDDLSLVGTDDGFISALVDPPLTVIAQDMEIVGAHAAELLLSRLAGDDQPARTITVQPEVMLRHSCDRPPK